jgi:hypothetical protein
VTSAVLSIPETAHLAGTGTFLAIFCRINKLISVIERDKNIYNLCREHPHGYATESHISHAISKAHVLSLLQFK